jgi:hypothetical protein
MQETSLCVLIGGVCYSCDSGSSLTQRYIKRGHVRAQEPTFIVSIVPPQTLASQSDPEGVEARGTAHCATAIVVFSTPTPPTPTMTTAATMSSSSSAQGISK